MSAERPQGIAMFGGSFNPPHRGHMRVALTVLKQFKDIEKILFMTCARPPHRNDLMPAPEERLEMVSAATAINSRFEASSLEIDRPGESQTAETVRQLRHIYGPDVRIYLIIGADHVFGIADWPGSEVIFAECILLIAPRGSYWVDQISQWKRVLPAHVKFQPIKLKIKNVLSSGMVRARVKAGLKIGHLVDAETRKLILERGYYTQDWISKVLAQQPV